MRRTPVTNAVQADVALRIDAIRVECGRPLIICDADEVIADFMGGFEPFLHGRGLYFNWASYRLNGNIRRRADGTPADADEIRALIAGFYDACIDTLAPVDGAVAALAALARRAGVVVLSNQPPHQRERREAWLARLGIGFPTVANAGPKGPAVHALGGRVGAPVYFIDDSPQHHHSVAGAAGHVYRLHFVANPRLTPLIETAPDCHARAASWAEARALIEADLAARGY